MPLLEDRQDQFGGPRLARWPDYATDLLPGPLNGGGFPIYGAKLWDAGGQFYNIMAYGGATGGVTDNTTALAAAQAARDAEGGEGIIYLPPGTFRFSNGLSLIGEGKGLKGAGRDATFIIVDAATPVAVTLGASGSAGNKFTDKISDLTIGRAGTAAAGTIGIHAPYFGYGIIEDVKVVNHDTGIKTGNDSLGLYLNRCIIHGCNTRGLWIKDGIEVVIRDSNFGVNGEVHAPTECFILLDGTTNDVRLSTVQVIGRLWPNTCAGIKWVNTGATPTGFVRLTDVNMEQLDCAFASDATAAVIADVTVIGGRIAVNGSLARFNAVTIGSLNIIGTTIAFGLPTTLTLSGGSLVACPSINGELTVNGGHWLINDNTFTTDSHYTGNFACLNLIGNRGVFNGVAEIDFDITGTGNITAIGNTKDAGEQPAIRLPGQLEMIDYTPEVTAGAGAITAYVVTEAAYAKIGPKLIQVCLDITITDVGTAATDIRIELPAAASSRLQVLAGIEDAINGAVLRVWIDATAAVLRIKKYDNTFYAANGYRYVVSGVYEAE